MPSAGKPGMEGRPACRQAGSEVFFATDCTDNYLVCFHCLPACRCFRLGVYVEIDNYFLTHRIIEKNI